MVFHIRNEVKVMNLLVEGLPDRTHIIKIERYFPKGFEVSTLTVNEGKGMRAVQNLSEVQ